MTGREAAQGIELFVALLGVAAVVAIAARPLRLPYTVALVVVGLGIGAIASAVGLGGGIVVTPELVLLVLLPGLVFEAAYRLRLDQLRRWFLGLLLLAIPGVLISAAVVAIVLQVATGLPLGLAFIVGAMVSATDPAAVVATFKRLPVSPSLATIVDGESLLNDGTGLVLFAIALRMVGAPVAPGDAVVSFVAAVVISPAIGLGLGYLAARLVAGLGDHLIELTVTVVLAYGSYLIAEQLHLSGVIATVAAGVVFGSAGRARAQSATLAPADAGPARLDHTVTHPAGAEPAGTPHAGSDPIDTVWEFLAFLLTAVVFLLVGLAIPPARLLGSIGPIVWAIVAVLAARALIVYGLLGVTSHLLRVPGLSAALPGAWLHVLFWAGLRGAVAVAMALALPLDLPQRALLQEITFGVVLFTLLVQATTIGPLVSWARTRLA